MRKSAEEWAKEDQPLFTSDRVAFIAAIQRDAALAMRQAIVEVGRARGLPMSPDEVASVPPPFP